MPRSRVPFGAFVRACATQLSAQVGFGLVTAAALGGSVVGCSGADPEPLEFGSPDGAEAFVDSPADSSAYKGEELAPYAHVDVRITERVDGANSEVLAHFVYSSERAYADAIASLSRPDRVLPAPGRCVALDPRQHSARAEPSALLEAGSVTLRAVPLDTSLTPVEVSLAPRAFPGFSSLSPGVVYTSRDRQPLLLAGASYEVDVQGGSDVPAMKLRASAPRQLTSVTVAGTPLRQVTELGFGQPIDITWDVSTNAAVTEPDVVYADLTSKQTGLGLLRCAYLDSAGSGTLPWTDVLTRGLVDNPQATLNLQRHRRATSVGLDSAAPQGELRFAFELTLDVNFVTTATP